MKPIPYIDFSFFYFKNFRCAEKNTYYLQKSFEKLLLFALKNGGIIYEKHQ